MNSRFLTSNNVSSTEQRTSGNDCGAASMSKDSIRTRVITFDTAKHFIIPIETLFV